jgi:hypothetical protein
MARIAPLAVALVAAAAGAAAADSTHRIRVESTPPGAHVYLGDVESGAKCDATPCEFEAPLGDNTVIIRLDHYKPTIEQIDVKRSRDKKPQVFKYELEAAVATIVCDDPKAKGASIQINGHEKGKCPAHVEVDPGGVQVIIKLGGKTLFEDFVDVDAGAEKQLELTGGGGGKGSDDEGSKGSDDDSKGSDDDGKGSDDDGKGSGDGSGGSVTKPAETGPRARFINAQVVVDVGWRRFAYENPVATLPATEQEDGQVIAGPQIELWPAELAHSQHLRGLSILARAEFKLNQLDVTDGTTGMVIGKTYWGSYEGSVRNRWSFDSVAVEAGAGYVRDQVQYDTDSASLGKLPSADYQSIRIGGRALLREGALEPYLSAETRIVMSGGDLQNRFTNASATGLRAAIGAALTQGALFGRIELSYLRYSWTFPAGMNTMATGATDQLFGLSFNVGYLY